jgi:hypothetical protein
MLSTFDTVYLAVATTIGGVLFIAGVVVAVVYRHNRPPTANERRRRRDMADRLMIPRNALPPGRPEEIKLVQRGPDMV